MMVLAASVWLIPAPPVRAQEIDEAKVLKVKAAYLYNFAKFITWPDDALGDAQSTFIIGILGDDRFQKILSNTVEGKKIANRPVKIERFHWSEQADRARLKTCQVLYISHAEQSRLKDIFAELEGHPVLLVASLPDFAGDGGMIGFVLDKHRIIFEINREALAQAELKASAKLLKLARIVQTGEKRLQESRSAKGKP